MKVSVYELIDPEKIVRQEGVIQRALSKESSGRPIDLNFYISSRSGCFKFFDETKIWRNDKPLALPKKAKDVVDHVSAYFQTVNQRIAKYRQGANLRQSDLPDPFPQDSLRHQFSYPLFKNGNDLPDHWISNWMLFLPAIADDEILHGHVHRCPVFGGNVEVRIGSNFQIVGVICNLRPWHQTHKVEAFHRSDDHHEITPHKSDLFFVSDAPAEPQNYLAPFYHEQSEKASHYHGLSIVPTCIHALLINIGIIKDDNEQGLKLFPMIMDGEGIFNSIANNKEWKKVWQWIKMNQGSSPDPVKTDEEEIELNVKGIYHIELLVEHAYTGVYRTTYKQVVVGSLYETSDKLKLFS